MTLTAVEEKFILHWGEMSSRWGVNRTVAQIHALLYLSPEPLNAEQIADTLSVARSNVSTSLRELQAWGIVRVVHVLGDRRDHFETLKDVWELFQIILDERKKREIDPTLALLRELVEQTQAPSAPRSRGRAGKAGQPPANEYTRERLEDLLDFFETMTTWYGQIRNLPQGAMIRFVKMGRKVRQLLSAAS